MSEHIAGFHLTRLDETGSTSDVAKQRAADGAPDGTAVTAKTQSGGRGRRGREWISPPGNLYVSVVLRPACAPLVAATLSFVAALAAAETVAAFVPTPDQVRCKWPNDILVDGRKIAGILLESSISHEQLTEWVVLGVGINLANHPEVKGPHPSTSLSDLGVLRIDVDTALERFLTSLATWRARWRDEGFAPIRAAWRARAFGVGECVTVALGREQLTGRFEDLDETGGLVLALGNGDRRIIAAGEVFFSPNEETNAAGN